MKSPCSSPEDSFVSDKIFTISEFVSDILDLFFNNLTNNNDSFSFFKNNLISANKDVSSTPENKSTESDTVSKKFVIYQDSPTEEQVTSFKRSMSEKSGNEAYWFAIQKSNFYDLPKSPQVQKEIINVDDIPLKPPPNYNKSLHSPSHKLSPIPEEANRSLFYEDDYSDDDLCSGFNDLGVQNISQDTDILGGGDNEQSSTYVAFDHPEINVIVCDALQFHRTNTINTASYVHSSTVKFYQERAQKQNGNKESDSDSPEDWSGFESAKF